MKWFIVIIVILVSLSCKQGETTSNAVNTTPQENDSNVDTISDIVKESIFLTIERTPCFGHCPNYKITIMNTGQVLYNGIKFTKKEGQYTKMLSAEQLAQIQSRIYEINLFEMNNKYDQTLLT